MLQDGPGAEQHYSIAKLRNVYFVDCLPNNVSSTAVKNKHFLLRAGFLAGMTSIVGDALQFSSWELNDVVRTCIVRTCMVVRHHSLIPEMGVIHEL